MNVLDILTTSPHFFYRKCVRATNENLNFDLRVQRVNASKLEKFRESYNKFSPVDFYFAVIK